MREGVAFNEVSAFCHGEATSWDRLLGIYSHSKNHLPFQLVSLNPEFPENLSKRGNLNIVKFLSFQTCLSGNLNKESTNSVVIQYSIHQS